MIYLFHFNISTFKFKFFKLSFFCYFKNFCDKIDFSHFLKNNFLKIIKLKEKVKNYH